MTRKTLGILVPLIIAGYLFVSAISTPTSADRPENSWKVECVDCSHIPKPSSVGANPSGAVFYELGSIMASDHELEDSFGYSADIDGDIVVVGNFLDDDTGISTGSAYIYELLFSQDELWVTEYKVTGTLGLAYEYFGNAVAVYSTTVVVGAHGGGINMKGAAYVFERDQGGVNNWGLVTKLSPPSLPDFASFGGDVDIYGDTIVVGAYADDNEIQGENSGSVYVFQRDFGGVDNWGLVKRLTAPDGKTQDNFGEAVAIDENTILVGAPNEDSKVRDAGAVYIFERSNPDSDDWKQIAKLTASNGYYNCRYGIDIDIDGNYALVGSAMGSIFNFGYAYVLARNTNGTGTWEEQAQLRLSEEGNNAFGSDVAIEEDIAGIGAPGDSANGISSGAMYVFFNENHSGNWIELGKIVASDGNESDTYGYPIAINNNIMVVGAHQKEDEAGLLTGAIYLYYYEYIYSVFMPVALGGK